MNVLAVVGVFLLATLVVLFVRRPRLKLEVSLRGTTRRGMLYVVLSNPGPHAAQRVRVLVGARGLTAAESREIGVLEGRDSIRLEVDRVHDLLAGVQGEPVIEVRARAWNALPARASIALAPTAPRASAEDAPRADAPSVKYARPAELPCSDSPDGAHLYERRPFTNDGVTEQWSICKRCRHVVRDPLTPEQEATQARVRKERLARERRIIEEELARRAREEGEREPGVGGASARRGRTTWRRMREEEDNLARDVDTFPPEVAFLVLGLDASRATWQDVLAAHRKLALENHPDRRPGADAATRAAHERRMQEINVARDRLREHFGLRAPIED